MADHLFQIKYNESLNLSSLYGRQRIKKVSIILTIVFLPLLLIGQSIIFSDQGAKNIKRSSKTGVHLIEILSMDEVSSPAALVLDENTGILYIGDGARILTAQGNFGQNQNEIISDGLSEITGITIDIDHSPGKIYWTEVSGDVKRANLNGSQIETILSGNDLSGPTAITIYPATSTLYIADGNRIVSCDLDGGNLTALITTGLSSVRGLAVDKNSGIKKLYWTDVSNGVNRSNLDGTEIEEVIAGNELSNPDAIALDFTESPNKIFLGDGNRILRSFIDGSELTAIITENLQNITDIVISSYAPCKSVTIVSEPVDQKVCEGESVIFKVSATGSLPLNFQWRKNGQNITNATDSVLSGSPRLQDAGVYDCVVSNPCGSKTSAGAELIIYPKPLTNIGPDPAEVCADGEIILDGNPSGGSGNYTTHLWEGQTSFLNSTTTQIVTFKASTAGTYLLTYTVTDEKGCKNTDEITVTVHPNPIMMAGEDRVICEGETVTLAATTSEGTPPYTYLWNNGITTAQNPVSPLVTTTYTVKAKDQKTCSAEASVTVVVNPNPTASAGSGVNICQGESVVLNASASGGTPGYSYNWNNTSGQSNPVTPQVTTTYSVTVTDSKTCNDVATVTVVVFPNPEVSLGGDQEICEEMDATIDLSISSGTPEFQVMWNDGSEAYSRTESPSETTTYSVQVTDSEGCKGSDQMTLTVNPKPFVSLGDDQEICEEDEVTLTALTTSGTEPYRFYDWDHGKVGESIIEKPTETTSFSVTVTDDKGCEGSDKVGITVYPKIELGLTEDSEICHGQDIDIGAEASGGTPPFIYTWDDGVTDPMRNVMPDITTNYSITVTDQSNDVCKAEGSIEVTVNPLPVVKLGEDHEICKGDKVTLTATVTEGTPPYKFYNWSPSNVGESIEVTPEENTTYSVTVTDEKNCEGEDQVVVKVSPPLVIDAGENRTISEGDSILIAVEVKEIGGTPPFRYKWNDGDTSFARIVSPIATTTYQVTVTDKIECTAVDQITVTVKSKMQVSINATKVEVCTGKETVLGAIVENGEGTLSYSWSNGETTPTIREYIDVTNIYSVTVTDSKGRRNFAQIKITALPLPKVELGPNQTIIEGKQKITLSPNVTGGTPGYTGYLWENKSIEKSRTVSPKKSTVYAVTVTDSKGCKGSDDIGIFVLPKSGEGRAGPDKLICKGDTTTIGLPGLSDECFRWIPTTGMDPEDADKAMVRVFPSSKQPYKLIIYGDDFSYRIEDEVVVDIINGINSFTVKPKKCCWKVGDELKLDEFEFTTDPPGVEITKVNMKITPNKITSWTEGNTTDLVGTQKEIEVTFTFICGDKEVPPQKTKITAVNENVSITETFDLGAYKDLLGYLNDTKKFITGVGPCDDDEEANGEEGGFPIPEIQIGQKRICCPDAKKEEDKTPLVKSLEISWSPKIAVSCEFATPPIVYGISGIAVFGASAGVKIFGGGEGTCDFAQVCFGVEPSASISGGVGASFLQFSKFSVAKATGVIVGTATAKGGKYCIPVPAGKSGFVDKINLCFKADLELAVQLVSWFTIKRTSPLFDEKCIRK